MVGYAWTDTHLDYFEMFEEWSESPMRDFKFAQFMNSNPRKAAFYLACWEQYKMERR